MPNDIGKTLKDCRTSAKMTVKEISDLLTSKGYKASESTIYSWENGNSQPTPGALLTMCTAYGIKDVLSIFGYDGYMEDGTLRLNVKEQDIIEKYRLISEKDADGKALVDSTVDYLCKKIKAMQDEESQLATKPDNIIELHPEPCPTYFLSYLQKMASAGRGEYLFDSLPIDTIEVPANTLSERADFVISVNGDSMEPTYYDGDKVYVEQANEITTGKIGIFVKGNECFIKEAGNGYLKSHNKKYPDIYPDDTIELVGIVLGKVEEK